MPDDRRPLACVLGDMDLVRALGLAGVRCAVVAPVGSPTRYSRFCEAVLEWADAWDDPDRLVQTLVDFASAQALPPVLFYDEDGFLLLISRHRSRLGQVFRFVIPDAALVEALVDKERFQSIALRLDLPVPAAQVLWPVEGAGPGELRLTYPIIVKPLTRRPSQWAPVGRGGKATQVNSTAELHTLWPTLASLGVPLLAQELVPGAETAIESYHVYVDEAGQIAAEFCGQKIRTYPRRFGDSTALVTTNASDVTALGREVVRRLNFRGVAKLDFKRSPEGRLYLLEINPRFSLWHHVGALAGVNIPAIVYADVIGLPRSDVRQAAAGVRWCRMWQDVRAARDAGMPLLQWLRWAIGCDAKSAMAIDDPLPLLGAAVSRGLARLHPRIAPRHN